MLRASILVVVLAGCIRAPARLDVAALVAQRGPIEARHDLEIRIVNDPRDLQAHLALAALAEQQQRPSQAIAVLEHVIVVGGPIGTRWHADDRARLARLVLARGQERLARGAPTALADLERARSLGAVVGDDDLGAARVALAVVELRHVDAAVRARGKRRFAATTDQAVPDLVVRGASDRATPAQRGAFGVWLWSAGARRAAWEELDAWHASKLADPELTTAYLDARAWWQPIWSGEAPVPDAADLVGPERCRLVACRARDIAGDADAERAFVGSPHPRIADPIDAAAVIAIALRDSVRTGEGFGRAIARHVDLVALAGSDPQHPFPEVARQARAVFARLIGSAAPIPTDAELATADERTAAAAARALAGLPIGDSDVVAQLAASDTPDAPAADATASDVDDPLATAVAAAVARVLPRGANGVAIARIVAGYRRDPAIADRLARDAVAESDDAALGEALVGATFDALGDPARARTAWQAAVDAAAEPRFQAGLALAIARAGDGDAALVAATAAAAASGDPAVVWLAVARALAGVGKPVHAIEAARYAIELADAGVAIGALDVAAAASRVLGRDAQADAFAARRAKLSPEVAPNDDDPTDAIAAVAAYRRFQTATTIARLWVASRWSRADAASRVALLAALEPSDARRTVIRAELVRLAGGADAESVRLVLDALRAER